MEKFLSPGWKARPKAEAKPKPKGRPKKEVPEGAMTLGERRPRVTDSNQKLAHAQMMKEMHRRLEALETIHAEASGTDEKVEKMMTLHIQAEEENKKLREDFEISRAQL